MTEGWVCLHRKMAKWEWSTDPNTSHLFLHCLIRANYEDTKWRGIEIKRGEFITSYKSLSQDTGLSVQQVRTALKKLISTSNLTSKTTNKYQVISVTNYNKYQDSNKQPNNQITNNQQTNNKQITTDNNNNNKNNNSIIKPDQISDDVWNDFKKLRNKKKAPITRTVINQFSKQAQLAGISLEDAILECCTRGWTGFKAEWYNKNNGLNNHGQRLSKHEQAKRALGLTQ